jgi:hypothetical protein
LTAYHFLWFTVFCGCLSSFPRHLPDQTLRSILAVQLGIKTVAAVVGVITIAAFRTESCLVLHAYCNCLPIRMIFALHEQRLIKNNSACNSEAEKKYIMN